MEKKKVTKTKEKTETKEKVITKLSKDKQERLRTLSKITHIVAKVLGALTIIAVSFLLLLVVMTPVIVKNIKVEDNAVSLFGTKIEYMENSDSIDLIYDNYVFGTLTRDEKPGFEALISELSGSDMTRVFGLFELALIAEVAVLFLFYFILKYADTLFANISKNDIPFTDENNDYLSKIAYLSMVSVIILFVADIISSLFFDYSMVRFNLVSIILVLVLYCASYLFEYACVLQKNSKLKLYGKSE